MSPNLTPAQAWWTAEEIAAAGLPDMPTSKRGVNVLAERLDWRGNAELARRRDGKGGGWEYSWRLFPMRAQRKLLAEVTPAPAKPAVDRDEIWSWYEALPQDVKDKAAARLAIIKQVEALEPITGIGRNNAVCAVARHAKVGARTIWDWFGLIEGVRVDDRLPHLAPRHRATPAKGRAKECAPEFMEALRGDYLRQGEVPFSDAYRRAVRIAEKRGWSYLPERTMRRWIDADVSRPTQILLRKGIDAVKRLYPVQVRDKTAMLPMECVNGDFHKWDVFVRWPGIAEPIRPQMVAFQDVYSGRILAWRMDVTPNSTAVLLCAGDMIETWGIPDHVLLDNGREFASKAVTGGASNRFRFKVKEDDIPGLFTGLGCTIHWATPYSGQSKPIERAFRDMCHSIAQDPRFEGAYTGNSVDAKPENYGNRAIPMEDFLRIVGEGIEEHNTRQGRRSEVAYMRSFAEVFDEAYAKAPIKKATAAQRRLWLLAAESIRADRNTGAVWLGDNEFWDDWMHEIAGQRVIVRVDPANFWDGAHIYTAENAYLGFAPIRQKGQFFNADEARAHSRARNDWLRAEKAKAAALAKMSAIELGKYLDDAAPSEPIKPDAKVVKPIFGKGPRRPEAGTGIPSAEVEAAQAVIVADLASRRNAQTTLEETARERFRRALDLERSMQAGDVVTREQERWLSVYQTSSEYRSERALFDDFGDAIFG